MWTDEPLTNEFGEPYQYSPCDYCGLEQRHHEVSGLTFCPECEPLVCDLEYSPVRASFTINEGRVSAW